MLASYRAIKGLKELLDLVSEEALLVSMSVTGGGGGEGGRGGGDLAVLGEVPEEDEAGEDDDDEEGEGRATASAGGSPPHEVLRKAEGLYRALVSQAETAAMQSRRRLSCLGRRNWTDSSSAATAATAATMATTAPGTPGTGGSVDGGGASGQHANGPGSARAARGRVRRPPVELGVLSGREIMDRLWGVYTYYSILDNVKEPEVLVKRSFVHLLRDCSVTSTKNSSSSGASSGSGSGSADAAAGAGGSCSSGRTVAGGFGREFTGMKGKALLEAEVVAVHQYHSRCACV